MRNPDQSSVEQPRVLARTERWLAVFKPAGWLTVPGRTAPGEGPAPVLSDWASGLEGPQGAWTVHRLDRETSGVVLFARAAEAHREASLWFQKHEVRKTYDLLAQGSMSLPMSRLAAPIAGAPSVTQVELRERFEGAFLARARPLTGRRHQIRIHLAGQGTPLLGDPRYGGPRELAAPKGGAALSVARVALHAARLELPSREVFEAPWPEDFSAWVACLREGR